ncbi:hypothetical protein ACFPAG_08695 [Vogesella sp. GCM10023246]|uniref:DUF4034 domain-containing protein n=1 Tax=Vogesella oryzagri TaxID=3160864 RepID=A0ABV1M3B4_9NEIS
MRRLALLILLLVSLLAVSSPITPDANRRSEEQTFLTYPEWFLVHSPAEYARYVTADRPLSDFPFWGHIRQLWSSYASVTEATASYPLNTGYHVMILVIASSTTIEYGLRLAYERTLGRLGEWLRGPAPTAEESYAARIAQDYVNFIRVLPWYEYDFVRAMHGLWRLPASGDSLFRKWERRYALSTEYLVKAGYGWLIKQATQASYGTELLTTLVVLDRQPSPNAQLPDFHPLQTLPDGRQLVRLPRYEAFSPYAEALAQQGTNFREIAGNPPQAKLLLTILTPVSWRPGSNQDQLLFEQPLLTEPTRKRVALVTRVGLLGERLRQLHSQPVELEHIYDY